MAIVWFSFAATSRVAGQAETQGQVLVPSPFSKVSGIVNGKPVAPPPSAIVGDERIKIEGMLIKVPASKVAAVYELVDKSQFKATGSAISR